MVVLLLLVVLVALPAFIGTLVGRGYVSFGGHIFRGKFHTGAPIVYRVVETSTCPGPEARDIHPAERGELYYYLTHKYWRVEEVRQDGWIVAYNDETLEELWRFNVGTALKGSPVTYAIGPKQYLAVQAGGRHLHPVKYDKLQDASYMFVFALN